MGVTWPTPLTLSARCVAFWVAKGVAKITRVTAPWVRVNHESRPAHTPTHRLFGPDDPPERTTKLPGGDLEETQKSLLTNKEDSFWSMLRIGRGVSSPRAVPGA